MARSRGRPPSRQPRRSAAPFRFRWLSAGGRAREREAKAAILSTAKASAATGRASRREANRLARQASILGRGKIAATRAVLAAQAEALRKQARELDRAAAATERPLKFLRVPAAHRTPYQRREISRVVRQIERGERPSIARASRPSRPSLQWYRQYLEDQKGDAVRQFFEMLPIDEQREHLDDAIVKHALWNDAGRPANIGYPFTLFSLYQWE